MCSFLPLPVTLLLLALSTNLNSQAQEIPGITTIPPEWIETSLVPDKTEIMLGEPTYLSYVVKNKSDRDLSVIVGGDYRNSLGRPDTFRVTVIDDTGVWVPQPSSGTSMGGLVGPEIIPAFGSYTFRLFLPHWATFERPGSYVITADRLLDLRGPAYVIATDRLVHLQVPREVTANLPSYAEAKIRVIPLDAKLLGRRIEELGAQMLADGHRSGNDESHRALADIRDERTIPLFLQALHTSDYSLKFIALDALSRFNNDQALAGLEEGMRTTADDLQNMTTREVASQSADGIRHAASVGLSRSPHPKALPFLLEQMNDPYFGVRLSVVHALGSRVKADVALPKLEAMTRDSNSMVSSEARRYLAILSQKR